MASIILNMVNENIKENINCNQFGRMGGASTTDALVEMIHRWSEATDKLDLYVRVALLDFIVMLSTLSTIIHKATCHIKTVRLTTVYSKMYCKFPVE